MHAHSLGSFSFVLVQTFGRYPFYSDKCKMLFSTLVTILSPSILFSYGMCQTIEVHLHAHFNNAISPGNQSSQFLDLGIN